jgi:hypothetical protein
VVARKVYDLSPIDPSSFDVTPGPSPGPPPTNTAPPTIQMVDGVEVGDVLAVTPGTWSGSPTLTRQWLRDGAAIAAATAAAYSIVAADVGAAVSASSQHGRTPSLAAVE